MYPLLNTILPIPSTIFEGTETAALLSWSQIAYCSYEGYFLTSEYTYSVNSFAI